MKTMSTGMKCVWSKYLPVCKKVNLWCCTGYCIKLLNICKSIAADIKVFLKVNFVAAYLIAVLFVSKALL